jgi:RHS repeat-associated protein
VKVVREVSSDVESDSTIEFNHTVEEGENRLLILTYTWRRNSGQETGTPTFNDINMTLVATIGDPGGDYKGAMYYLVNPPVGTYEIQIPMSGSTWVLAGAYTLYRVDPSDPLVEYQTDKGTGPVSLTLSSQSGDMGVDHLTLAEATWTSVGENQTQRWKETKSTANWKMAGASSTEGATGGQVAMSYDVASGKERSYIAAVIRAWRPPPPPTDTPTPTPEVWPTPITQTPQPAGTYENTNGAWYYTGAWTQVDDASDSGGSRHRADIPWSAAQLTFTGNGFDFVYRSDSSFGIAELYLDGEKVASVDQYSETTQTQQSIHVTLTDGDHVLEVRRADRKNVDSSGYSINLDKVVALGSATSTPTETPTITSTPTPSSTPTTTPTHHWITVGSIVSTDVECGSSVEFDHTVEEGEDRLLIVTFAHRRDNHQDVSGVSFNGVSLTKVAHKGDPGGDEAIAHMWYLADPPVGTYTVQIGVDYYTCMVAGAYTLYGVDLLDPLVDYDTSSGTGPVSLTLDSQPGDMGVDIVGEDGGGGLTPGEGQIERWDQTKTGGDWTLRAASSTEGGMGSQITMSYDVSSTREYGYVAAVFRAIQSHYPTPTPTSTPNATPTSTPETGWESAYYTYSSSHPHAVSSVQRDDGTDTFSYDNAGNMTSRVEAGTTWTQGFDEEGRLDGISDGTDAWGFVYDGDGARVKQENPDGTTTLFLGGGSYEVHVDGETTTVKKYYAAGGQRVMRDGDGLHYLLTDHLGSVVGMLDSNGDLETDERYLPFGGLRDTSGITETDFAFTGQRNMSDVGLMDYNARWYSPSIGRFISPDSLVAQPGNPQALNRYAYVSNNPLRYIDPSGHFCAEVGTKVICSADDDSNMYWWPDWKPLPITSWENPPSIEFEFVVGPPTIQVDDSIDPKIWNEPYIPPGFQSDSPMDPPIISGFYLLAEIENLIALFSSVEYWETLEPNIFVHVFYSSSISDNSFMINSISVNNLSKENIYLGDIVVSNGYESVQVPIVGKEVLGGLTGFPPYIKTGERYSQSLRYQTNLLPNIFEFIDVTVRIRASGLIFRQTQRIPWYR